MINLIKWIWVALCIILYLILRVCDKERIRLAKELVYDQHLIQVQQDKIQILEQLLNEYEEGSYENEK